MNKVVTEKRHKTYRHPKTNDLIEGWEIVKEISLCFDCYEQSGRLEMQARAMKEINQNRALMVVKAKVVGSIPVKPANNRKYQGFNRNNRFIKK